MSGYIAFLKKEFIEDTRNYRLLLMLGLYFIFGVMGPLSAKFMPELIKTFSPNMQIIIEEPSALESWTQFYKNVSSLGLSLTLIIFSNCLSNEYTKGTLTIMLTKGLSRPAVILSKFSSIAVIMTVSFWMCFGVTYGYTAYLWPSEELSHLLFAAFALWLSAMLYLCILMFGCVLFQQAFASILFLLVITLIFSLLGMTDLLSAYSPSFLSSKNIDLISGTVTISEFAIPITISLIMSGVLLFLSITVFNKKQL